jgi:hypothetical protein
VSSNGKHVNNGILNTSKNSSWKYHSMYLSEDLCYNCKRRKTEKYNLLQRILYRVIPKIFELLKMYLK